MFEITAEVIQKFLQKTTLNFAPTHNKLSLPIINRIYKKMINDIKFDSVKVIENCIIDGHHRFISAALAQIKINVITYPKSSATIQYSWKDVLFVNEEWDTADKIQYLNELDAKYNDLSIEKIIEMCK